MCRPATCQRCGKTGWAGCGSHVEQVMAGVPHEQRCRCDAQAPAEAGERRRWKLFR